MVVDIKPQVCGRDLFTCVTDDAREISLSQALVEEGIYTPASSLLKGLTVEEAEMVLCEIFNLIEVED